MYGQGDRDLELIAAALVAELTAAQARRLDPGGGRTPLPDFELIDASGRVGVLEVSSVRSAERASFERAKSRMEWLESGISHHWYVVVSSSTERVKVLRLVLPSLLARIPSDIAERGFIEIVEPQAHRWFPNGLADDLNTEFRSLGISRLSAMGRPAQGEPGYIHVQPPAVGGAIGPRLVTEEVQTELDRPHNLTKLQVARQGERAEFFVWLLDSFGSLALNTPLLHPDFQGGFPVDGPSLTLPVTGVWVANGPTAERPWARSLWHSSGGTWVIVDLPT